MSQHSGIPGTETAANDAKSFGPLPRLSKREQEVLYWAAVGKSDREIGIILSISKKTANMHIENAKRKYGVRTRTQLVFEAGKMGDNGFTLMSK